MNDRTFYYSHNFFSCSSRNFSNWSGFYLASSSSCLYFPFPRFTFPSHSGSQSETVWPVPLNIASVFLFQMFLPSPLFIPYLLCIFFSYPLLHEFNFHFLVQPVLQSLVFIHTNFIPHPFIFFLLSLPSSPHLLSPHLSGFSHSFSSTTSTLLSFTVWPCFTLAPACTCLLSKFQLSVLRRDRISATGAQQGLLLLERGKKILPFDGGMQAWYHM